MLMRAAVIWTEIVQALAQSCRYPSWAASSANLCSTRFIQVERMSFGWTALTELDGTWCRTPAASSSVYRGTCRACTEEFTTDSPIPGSLCVCLGLGLAQVASTQRLQPKTLPPSSACGSIQSTCGSIPRSCSTLESWLRDAYSLLAAASQTTRCARRLDAGLPP